MGSWAGSSDAIAAALSAIFTLLALGLGTALLSSKRLGLGEKLFIAIICLSLLPLMWLGGLALLSALFFGWIAVKLWAAERRGADPDKEIEFTPLEVVLVGLLMVLLAAIGLLSEP